MCGRRQPTLAGELESFRGLEVLWTTQAQPHRRHVTVYSSQDWTPGLGLQSHSCPGCCLSPHQKVQEVGFGWCEGSSGAVSPRPVPVLWHVRRCLDSSCDLLVYVPL